jgi:hypothetical protein
METFPPQKIKKKTQIVLTMEGPTKSGDEKKISVREFSSC